MEDRDLESLFDPGAEDDLETFVRLLHPADIAELFRYISEENWTRVTRLLTPDRLAEVLSHLDEGQLESIGAKLRTERLIQAVQSLESDDAADVLADLPEEKAEEVLHGLEADDRAELQTLLAFPEDSAGGLMQTELCKVNEASRVRDAIEAVRKAREEIDTIHEVFVVDDSDKLQGVVQLEDLVLSKEDVPIARICRPVQSQVTPLVDQEEVAQIFGKYDLMSLPVVDKKGTLLGRITFDDIHDVLEEEATEDAMAIAGASRESLVYGTDFFRIAAYRLPWLISTLLGSLLTTTLIPLFTRVPGNTILFVSFVPVVTAMTGNVGSQTAMIITRGFAIGKIDFATLGGTLLREMAVGFLMGLGAGAVVCLFSLIRGGTLIVGVALALSMICSMCFAAFAGAMAPAVFKKLGIDPAIAAGPLVTTGCDVTAVSIYLLIAILILG